jgi:hypothetical protein
LVIFWCESRKSVKNLDNSNTYFIDFGSGITEGMYPKRLQATIIRDGAKAADAMYILDMTLWQLWTSDHPAEDIQLPRIQNSLIRQIIHDCMDGQFQTIKALYDQHYAETASAFRAIKSN